MMRPSHASDTGRPSMGPLRIRNEQDSAIKRKSHVPTSFNNRFSMGFGSNSTKKNVAMSRLGSVGSSSGNRVLGRTSMKGDYVKDPRPVSDRAFKEKSIRDLVLFLTHRGYPHNISPKLLQSPLSKDFFRIYEFMVQLINPSYKLEKKGKIEEELPRFFKMLGYPFSISKSALFSVGSPHTWPTLLAALTWLRIQIEMCNSINVDSLIFPSGDDEDPDAMSDNKMKFLFFEECYKQFMEGADTFEELEEELRRKTATSATGGRDLEHEALHLKELQATLNQLENEPDELLACKELNLTLTQHEAKLTEYVASFDQHFDRADEQNRQADAEILQLEAELVALAADTKRKQHIFETQEFSQQDVQRINMERQTLLRKTENVDSEIQLFEQENWEEEMQISKAQEKLTTKCQTYNKVALSLGMIPVSAENSNGVDFEMRPDVSSLERDRFASNIKCALDQVRTHCMQRVTQASEAKMTAAEASERLLELVAESHERVEHSQNQLKQLQADIDSKREIYQKEVQRLNEELESAREEVAELRTSASMGVHEYQRQLESIQHRCERQQLAQSKELKELQSLITFALQAIIDHKSEIQKSCEAAVEFMQQKVAEAQENRYQPPTLE